MTAPNMAMITASLEKSLQNYSLYESNNIADDTDTGGGVGFSVSSSSSSDSSSEEEDSSFDGEDGEKDDHVVVVAGCKSCLTFGVVLLEILTGKIATSISGGGDVSKWVRGTMREKGMWEVLDFELLRYREMEAEMVALLKVALLCLAESERDRPKMGVVEKMIEDIMKKGGGGGVCSDSSPSLSESTPNFTSS
ncbi:putative leucine-rich repeat receptor-like protein kinase [Camellia lanceoleosa]|uniref:Leucine-rich repeat receptor-like protein kinase n=1 Tax=Camellia lanceoleosa TaxID=1840588 RepID=A0ACC0FGP9_9ERIC|nr:putative leucine-rich repeat receptor-like protein kinase [Camellia lanceoleosa]